MARNTENAFLRRILLADAATCAVSAVLMSAAAGPLSSLLKIPQGVLFYAGLSLFPIAVFIAVVATRTELSAAAIWLVVLGNISWVLGSLWLMLGGSINPNMLGQIYIAAQAFVVAALTWLEAKGAASLKNSDGAIQRSA